MESGGGAGGRKGGCEAEKRGKAEEEEAQYSPPWSPPPPPAAPAVSAPSFAPARARGVHDTDADKFFRLGNCSSLMEGEPSPFHAGQRVCHAWSIPVVE